MSDTNPTAESGHSVLACRPSRIARRRRSAIEAADLDAERDVSNHLYQGDLPDDLDLTGIPVAFFVGFNDRVFSLSQTRNFSRKIGGVTIYGYPEQGHLLFFTRPDVFEDMRAFVEGREVN